jgi:hypothetical protein
MIRKLKAVEKTMSAVLMALVNLTGSATPPTLFPVDRNF